MFVGEDEQAERTIRFPGIAPNATVSYNFKGLFCTIFVRPAGHRPQPPLIVIIAPMAGLVNVANCGRRLHLALLCFHFFLLLHVFEYIYRYTSFTEPRSFSHP